MKNEKDTGVSTLEKEDEAQRKGRNKSTAVNKTYIGSGEFRRKFDAITDSDALNRLLYNLGKKMLLHRSGSLYEDMYWIDADTGEVVASEIDDISEEEIVYSDKTIKVIEGYADDTDKHLITIHTHPNSYPPSIEDLNSNFTNRYELGIVVCHNGQVYLYVSDELIEPDYYALTVEKYSKFGYSIRESQIEALRKMQEHFKIRVEEA